MVKIINEPETRIRHSVSTEVFNDICNTYDSRGSKQNLIDYKETGSPVSRTPNLIPTQMREHRKSTQVSPLQFYLNENTNYSGAEKPKKKDSFIKRISNTNSVLSPCKEDE